MLTFCVSIPVLNEEKRLKPAIERLTHFLKANEFLYRVVIASNGSTDKTVEIAKQFALSDPSVTVLDLASPGVGRALKSSWDHAKEDIVGYMDVDLSVDLRHLLEVRQLFEEDPDLDFINGNRLSPQSIVQGRTWIRRFLSRALNLVIPALLGVRVGDAMCGFKFVRRERYLSLRQNAKMRDDWFFNAELLIRSMWNQFKVDQLPVEFTESSDSRVKIWKVSTLFLGAILRLVPQRFQRNPRGN